MNTQTICLWIPLLLICGYPLTSRGNQLTHCKNLEKKWEKQRRDFHSGKGGEEPWPPSYVGECWVKAGKKAEAIRFYRSVVEKSKNPNFNCELISGEACSENAEEALRSLHSGGKWIFKDKGATINKAIELFKNKKTEIAHLIDPGTPVTVEGNDRKFGYYDENFFREGFPNDALRIVETFKFNKGEFLVVGPWKSWPSSYLVLEVKKSKDQYFFSPHLFDSDAFCESFSMVEFLCKRVQSSRTKGAVSSKGKPGFYFLNSQNWSDPVLYVGVSFLGGVDTKTGVAQKCTCFDNETDTELFSAQSEKDQKKCERMGHEWDCVGVQTYVFYYDPQSKRYFSSSTNGHVTKVTMHTSCRPVSGVGVCSTEYLGRKFEGLPHVYRLPQRDVLSIFGSQGCCDSAEYYLYLFDQNSEVCSWSYRGDGVPKKDEQATALYEAIIKEPARYIEFQQTNRCVIKKSIK